MVGKSPLWVSKQHGHSIETMLRVYTAWTEGAVESDLKAIRRAMRRGPDRCNPAQEFAFGANASRSSRPLNAAADNGPSASSPEAETNLSAGKFPGVKETPGDSSGSRSGSRNGAQAPSDSFERENWRRERDSEIGFRGVLNQQVADSKITFVPTDPPQSPSLSPTSSLAIPLFDRL